MAFLVCFVILLLGLVLHLGGMALVGRLVGGKLKVIRLGFGPEVIRRRVLGFDLVLGAIPLGGYVQFWRSEDEGAPEGCPYFDELPDYRRALTQLAGPATLLLIGSVVSLSQLWTPMQTGWVDFFRGALSPRTVGPELLGEAVSAIRSLPFHKLLGLVIAKMAAWNLLPFPSLNGGAALLDIVLPSGDRGKKISAGIFLVGMLVLLGFLVAWLVAVWTFAT